MAEVPQEVRDNSQNFYRNPAGQIKERGTNRVVFDPGGGGDSGGGGGGEQAPSIQSFQAPNVAPEAFFSPEEFLKLARIQAEASLPEFEPDIPRLRELAQGNVSPFYEGARGVLDVQSNIAQQQAAISKGQIARSFDDAFEQLQESYNQRGLFFSGEELEAEGDLLTRRAENLSLSDLNLQQVMSNIEAKKGQLSLEEKRAVEDMFQTLLTSEESAFNTQKESAINRMIASVIPSFVESKGALENYKLSADARSRAIRDELNLQTLDIRSQTAPLDLALKLAKVENIPVDQATSLANLALKNAQVNRIPIEDAIQLANAELKQADVANIPIERQLLQARLAKAKQSLRLGVPNQQDYLSYAQGLNEGLVNVSSIPAKHRATVLDFGRRELESELQMSITPDIYLETLGETRGQVETFLDYEVGGSDETEQFQSFVGAG